MTSKILRISCLVVVLAILAGLFTGSQIIPHATLHTPNTPTNSIFPSQPTAPDAIFTTGAASVPQPTPPIYTKPCLPDPIPSKPQLPEPTVPPTTVPAPTDPPPTEPAPTDPPQLEVDIPKISAKNAFVYDTRTQEFLYASCDTDKALYPASITKLFSTYVALQYLDTDKKVTVGSELRYVAYDAAVIGYQKGDKVSVKTLVYSALLPSGCDASYILAAAAGRAILGKNNATAKDAINAFLKECNRRAEALGMENTHFANPDGYHDSDHYISLQGMAVIGQLALKNKTIAKAVATDSATITYTSAQGSKVSKTLTNTNKTILNSSKKYYHPLSVGLKTGTTDAAGACLLAAYKVDGGYILVGIFKAKSNNSRFTDANALFDAFYPYL